MANEGKDGMREMREKLDKPEVRLALVVIGVVILLRLRLILFAAALPVMAYWHYSNQSEEPTADEDAAEEPGAGEGEDDLMDLDGDDPPTFQSSVGRAIPDTEGLGDLNDEEGDPYGKSFWGEEDNNGTPMRKGNAGAGPAATGMGGGLVSANDFDFLGGNDDMDFMGGGFGKGKGKGKGTGGGFGGGMGDKSSGGKGFDGPRPGEPNPKQIFVAGIGDTNEDDIKIFFEDVGEVDRLKVLKQPDGQSKGVCFVTFRTEEQAQKALGMHGCDFAGCTLTVRLANGGTKGKGDEKGGGGGFGGGGGGGFGGSDRPSGGFGGGRSGGDDRGVGRPPDLGGQERFGAAFGDTGGGFRAGGKGGGGGKGGNRRNERGEMDELLEEALAEIEGPLKVNDFDFAARRFLSELKARDSTDGTQKFQEALDMVFKYTSSKDRSSVRKWPAYIFTLLQKFDPNLMEELRGRDAERRRDKGGGRGDEPSQEEPIRARTFAPPWARRDKGGGRGDQPSQEE